MTTPAQTRSRPQVLWIRVHPAGYLGVTGTGDVPGLLERLGIPARRATGSGWRLDEHQAADVEAQATALGWLVRHRGRRR